MGKIKIEIEGQKPKIVNKLPEGVRKKPVVPHNWGYLVREGKIIGKYQYIE